MTTAEYNDQSVDSIVEYASKIIGKSLAEVIDTRKIIENKKNKGGLGSLVEKHYFKISPPNTHDPDFPHAVLEINDDLGKRSYKGLELKTTGVLEKSKDKFTAKERLVLTMIDFDDIVHEEWDTSTFKKKCQLMLILLYLFEKDLDIINRKFVLAPILYELEIPKEDLAQIREDWETIQKVAAASKAHELSEGDTFYLKACRKGSGGADEALVKQHNSDVKAKSRAFSFNPAYLSKIISRFDVKTTEVNIEEDLGVGTELTFDEATKLKFKEYIGLTTEEISIKLNHPQKSKNNKGWRAELSNRMLTGANKRPKELELAGIELKTIRLRKSGTPREAMSFQAFKFKEIINENWEDSAFFDKIESKFLLVIFKEDANGDERLFKVAYWNMPYPDRLEAKRVWEKTKTLTAQSNTNFPKTVDNDVAHVRPKGKDRNAKTELPNGSFFLSQCFWLNIKYIKTVVESL